MVQNVRTIRVWVASPSDLHEDLVALDKVVDGVNSGFAEARVKVQLLNWEKDVDPGVGSYPQDVINRSMGDYDIFLGILWTRFGTPTAKAGSGTEEEFNRAYDEFKKDRSSMKLWIYFKSECSDLFKLDLDQLHKIRSFRESLGEKGCLYKVVSSGEALTFDIGTRLTARLAAEQARDLGKQHGFSPSSFKPDGPPTTATADRLTLPDRVPVVSPAEENTESLDDTLKYMIIGLPQTEGADFFLTKAPLFNGEVIGSPPFDPNTDPTIVEFTFGSIGEIEGTMKTITELMSEASSDEGFSQVAFLRALSERVKTRLPSMLIAKAKATSNDAPTPSDYYVILGVAKRAAPIFQAALLFERVADKPLLSEDTVAVRFLSLSDGQAWSDVLQRVAASSGDKDSVMEIVATAALGHAADKFMATLENSPEE